MAQLRWILLASGAVFLLGLAIWEFRRSRHAAGSIDAGEAPESAAWRDEAPINSLDDAALVIPEIRTAARHGDPPVLMLDEMRAADTDIGVSVALEVAVDRPGSGGEILDAAPWVQETTPEPAAREVPILWPPARQERIIWLRVVPATQTRLSGRALRHALTGSGMVHGPQDIFHWVDDEGQVVASAANLTRPGSFDLGSMDAQHYQGVHLFSVLPGPLAPAQTFDELLGLARDIAARVSGKVQDERGEPVDAARVAQIRESLQPRSSASSSGEDHEADA